MTPSIEVTITSDLKSLFDTAKPDTELYSKALALYPYVKNETISHGTAAEIVGISKWELIQIYGDFGFNYIEYEEGELEKECETILKLIGERS